MDKCMKSEEEASKVLMEELLLFYK